jgi:hypothetical protein
MTAAKVARRVEEVEWQPPFLTFQIERHGAAFFGSSRAELQRWKLDVDHGTLELTSVGHRQLRPMQPRLNVRPLAEEIAGLIRKRHADKRLKWYKDNRVRVLIREILPEERSPQQTRTARRKRFWTHLDSVLKSEWTRGYLAQTYSRRAHSTTDCKKGC